MGCIKSKEKEVSNGPLEPIGANDAPPKTVDPRLPFQTYRQLFQMKNSWKAVSRTLEPTAKDTFVRFFKAHPEYQALHKSVAQLDTEEKLLDSTAFENLVLDHFNVIDEAMECIEKDMVDAAISGFTRAGQSHGKIEGFNECYYRDLEPHFMKVVEQTLGDRFTENTEQNFRRLYEFWTSHMIQGLTDGASNRV